MSKKKLTVSEAEAALERAKADLARARAQETEASRKQDLHRKILGGAFLITLLPGQPKLLQAFHDYLSPKDRKAFGAEFTALKARELPATPPSRDLATGTEPAVKPVPTKPAPGTPVAATKGAP